MNPANDQVTDAAQMAFRIRCIRTSIQRFGFALDSWMSGALMHIASAVLVTDGMSRETFLELAGECFDHAVEHPERAAELVRSAV